MPRRRSDTSSLYSYSRVQSSILDSDLKEDSPSETTEELVRTPGEGAKLTLPILPKQPAPRDNTPVQCFVKRDRTTSTYQLWLQSSPPNPAVIEEGGKFLLAAGKLRHATSTEYIISMNAADLSEESSNYVGKLRSNFLGTKFTIYDTQRPNHGPFSSGTRANVSRRRISTNKVSPPVPAYKFNVAQIAYELKFLCVAGGCDPRRMHCRLRPPLRTIPASAMHLNGSASDPNATYGRAAGQVDPTISGLPRKDDLLLTNRAPRWHSQLQVWTLNFRGRVTVASKKNFQLVAATDPDQPASQTSDHDKVLLQFGKIGKDMFTMDFRYPLSAFQAFAICLSGFSTSTYCG
jgi:tubby-related protein 1